MIALDRTRQVAPQIAEILRNRILRLELAPQSVLSRAAIQMEFGVSQTPVRDALQQLADEGLVQIFPQSSTVVSPIDPEQARQAHFLRSAIEIEAIQKIAAAPDPDLIQRLRSIIAKQARCCEAEDFECFDDEDRRFHKALYEAADISMLWPIVRRHAVHIDRLRRLNLPRPGKMQSVLTDHIAIVDAVETEDPEAAASALRKHLSGTIALIATMASENPGFVSTVSRTARATMSSQGIES
ncbi:GntR family transcriptional regulator [Aquamicrobium sp. LC103]|uniref:GntR family transcriptional regulator n=1 Tax=Aquamicrobium sp. LC103 TaxID=1120658 RepID=UPI001FEFDA03|nr:GntR family transcriptional regulator [Aquamicrobium sp. LC103]